MDHDLVLDVAIPFLGPAAPKDRLRFVLVDTPGVTEAGGGRLSRSTLAALRESDAAILALNYAELRTSGEREFLARCARTRADLFLRPGRSFFCLVTKMDLRNRHGLGLRGVERHVHNQLGDALGERIPTLRQSVWPVRAELALLARLVSCGEADEGQSADYLKLLYGSQGVNRKIRGRELERLTERSVEISGIVGVEVALRDRVANSTAVVRHGAVRGRLINLVHRARSWAQNTRRWRLQRALSTMLDSAKDAGAPRDGEGESR